MEQIWLNFSVHHTQTIQCQDFQKKNLELAGEPLVDAMLYEPIPYRSALQENCTHILVLRSRPDGISVSKKDPIIDTLAIRRYFKGVLRMFDIYEYMKNRGHRIRYAEDILRLNEETWMLGRNKTSGPHIYCIALNDTKNAIGRLDLKSATLLDGLRRGFARVYDIFAEKPVDRGRGIEVAKTILQDLT